MDSPSVVPWRRPPGGGYSASPTTSTSAPCFTPPTPVSSGVWCHGPGNWVVSPGDTQVQGPKFPTSNNCPPKQQLSSTSGNYSPSPCSNMALSPKLFTGTIPATPTDSFMSGPVPVFPLSSPTVRSVQAPIPQACPAPMMAGLPISPVIQTVSAPKSAPPPPPPPPPPMPSQGATQSWRNKPKTQPQQNGDNHYSGRSNLEPTTDGANQPFTYLPPALHNTAMQKDKKPFTYTPGGLDFSELRSPRMQRRLGQLSAKQASPPPQQQPPPPQNQQAPKPTVKTQLPPLYMAGAQPVMLPGMMTSPRSANTGGSPAVNNQINYNNQINQSPRKQPQMQQQANSYSVENANDALRNELGQLTSLVQGMKTQDAVNHHGYHNPNEPDRGHPGQSRSFRVLQAMTDGVDNENDSTEHRRPSAGFSNTRAPPPEDEMRFSGLRSSKGPVVPSKAFVTLQRMTGEDNDYGANYSNYYNQPQQQQQQYQQQPQQQQQPYHQQYANYDNQYQPQLVSPGIRHAQQQGQRLNVASPTPQESYYQNPSIPASQQEADPEPRKYTGGNIPSRSFKMLQAMTDGEDETYVQETQQTPPVPSSGPHEGDVKMYMGSNIPSRSFRILQHITGEDHVANGENGVTDF